MIPQSEAVQERLSREALGGRSFISNLIGRYIKHEGFQQIETMN